MKVFANSTEVPHQALADGSFLVRATGGIAANSTTRWSVLPSRAAGVFAAQVWVTDTGSLYEIDNGIIAIRVPKTIPCPTPATFVAAPPEEFRQLFNSPSPILAPIQGIRHRNGTWTGANPNYLYVFYGYNASFTGGSWNWPATVPGVIEFIESGPLRVKVRITYSGLRPTSWRNLGVNTATGRELGPAWVIALDTGGYYVCTITLEAGQNTFNVKNELNGEINWHVDMSTGAPADRGRYKGHTCNDILKGHHYDGTIYNDQFNSVCEGEVNLSEAGTRDTTDWAGVPFDCVKYPNLYHWYDYSVNAGVYWYVYNSAGGSSSNAWGMIQGLPPYETAQNHNGVYGTPAAGTPTATGFFTTGTIRLIDERVGHPCKYDFNIMLGTKSTDVPVDFSAMVHHPTLSTGYEAVTPSGFVKAFNFCSGPAQAWKQADQGVEFPDPVGGWPGMHLTRADTETLIANLAADQGPGSYYQELYASDTQYRDIWDAFADETNALASDMVDDYCIPYLNFAINLYVNTSSYTQQVWFYFNGAQAFQRIIIRAMAMISLDQSPGRSFLTTLQRRQLKATLAMVGHVTCDQNFMPDENYEHSQFSYGTANSPQQYGQMKSQFIAVLKTHPQFTERYALVETRAIASFNSVINEYGAPRDNPAYAGALISPLLDVFRQLQVNGHSDLFAPSSSIYARMVLLGEWMLQVMSPPQSRFKKAGVALRKMVCYGDGASQAHNNALALIMGIQAHNPTLAKRLTWGWVSMNKSLATYYSSGGLKVTPSLLTQDPVLGDADIRGYATIMRSGWGTADESMAYIMHGEANSDHNNFEFGSPSIYLLSEPVCLTFGSMYTPYFVGPWDASTYIPVNKLDIPSLEYPGGVWNTYTDFSMDCGDHSAFLRDTYTHLVHTKPLRRDVYLRHARESLGAAYDVLPRRSGVPGGAAAGQRRSATGDSIYTLHLMATGTVRKPDGTTLAAPTTLNGTTFPILNGQRLEFTGQWGVSQLRRLLFWSYRRGDGRGCSCITGIRAGRWRNTKPQTARRLRRSNISCASRRRGRAIR